MKTDCIAIIANDPEECGDLHKIEPVLGKNKTAYLGRAMFFDTLATCLSMPGVDIAVYYQPSGSLTKYEKMLELFAHEEKSKSIRTRMRKVKLYPQNGERMIITISNAFKNIFDSGYKRAIMIGSYCVPLGPALIKAGFALLKDKTIVIGPSFSGRYYLFGMSECLPEVFDGVYWESNDFYIRLGKNINNLSAGVQELELSYEIYTPDDLNQLVMDIERWRSIGDNRTAYHTERFLRSLE